MFLRLDAELRRRSREPARAGLACQRFHRRAPRRRAHGSRGRSGALSHSKRCRTTRCDTEKRKRGLGGLQGFADLDLWLSLSYGAQRLFRRKFETAARIIRVEAWNLRL